ncbi:MAG TPA: acetyl-CoA synthetase [Candidatus Thorarchaeota archaeon]|nr:MAG: acetyl-CoA synthetase [Candidatus Thorarchaeota archaeon]HDD67397.1 acetyl-CoA synthetase [Candidatus Thorarchaeota archaeon]
MEAEQTPEKPDLDPFFIPRRIALVGASTDYRKLGNSILMNLLASEVEVYPVTRNRDTVLGVKAYPNLAAIPKPVDLVIVAIAAKHCPDLMKEIRRAGARHAVVISGGFSETGEEGARLEAELVNAAREAGVRLIGPNCVGISNSRLFNGTFTMMPERGNIGLVSQSGALGGMLIYTTKAKRIGMSKFASVGNAADIGIVDIVDYFREDPKTSVITIYIEGVKNGRRLFESLRMASEKKPVVVLKGGRSDAGGRATQSHTGSLAGSTRVFDGMIKQAGCVTAPTLDTLFEIAKLFDYQPSPRGRNIGIISNTGGAGVLAADAASDFSLNVPPIEENTRKALRQILSPLASVDNPVDVVASGGRREYRVTVELMLADPNVDMLMVICAVPTFAGMTQTEHAAGTLEAIRAAETDKPVVGVWLAGDVGKPGKDLLEMNRIPCYDDPYVAALCMSRVAEYAERHNRSEQ